MFILKFCDCRKATLEFILEKEEVLQFCLLQDNEPKTPRKTSSHQKFQDQDQPNQNTAKRLVPSQICGFAFFNHGAVYMAPHLLEKNGVRLSKGEKHSSS